MKYQCEKCQKTFIHTAKETQLLTNVTVISKPNGKENESRIIQDTTLEFSVCPYCQSKDFTEYIEPAPVQEVVSNVYIYDLTSGPQTELDRLLALGYRIVNRYSKQYHLEKPKEGCNE
ncbi:MAG: hypothetical protein ABSD42_04490 [Candidatus Bathyarchaeia archaeon]